MADEDRRVLLEELMGLHSDLEACERHYQPLVDAVTLWRSCIRAFGETERGDPAYTRLAFALQHAADALLLISVDFEPKKTADAV